MERSCRGKMARLWSETLSHLVSRLQGFVFSAILIYPASEAAATENLYTENKL
jgi:hypothetical protein